MSICFYNELDPYCVAWLKNLMAAKQIPKGRVDGRDIRKVKASNVQKYQTCHWFAGNQAFSPSSSGE